MAEVAGDGTGLAHSSTMIFGKQLLLPALAAACIGAAGVGAYFGVRADRSTAVMAGQPTPGQAFTNGPLEGPVPSAAAPATAPAVVEPSNRRPSESRTTSIARRAPGSRTASNGAAEVTGPVPAPTAEVAVDAPATVPVETETHAATAAEPEIRFDEVTVSEASVIGIRLESAVTSETAKVEDPVSARVTRDVAVDGRTVIPAGSELSGWVTEVERGGRFRERARVGIRFTSLAISDSLRVPIETETIVRDGDAPTGEATAKIGASAVVGAILGSVIGGKKGAAIGGAAGAAGGSAAVAAGGRNAAVIAAGSPLTVRLTSPATIRVARD